VSSERGQGLRGQTGGGGETSRDRQRDVGPGQDRQRDVGPGQDRQRDVGPGQDRQRDAGPGQERPGEGQCAAISPRPAEPPGVVALVLTHNVPGALRRCVAAIDAQRVQPARIVVVDNASVTPASEVLADRLAGTDRPPLSVHREPANGGPAGGWASALALAADSDAGLAWALDDDALPEPGCLEALLAAAAGDPRAVWFPRWIQPDGASSTWTAWCGVLLPTAAIRRAGLPRRELVWWAEDTEYFMWRLPASGYPVRHCAAAVVRHTKERAVWGNPPWKYYYEARNTTYYDLWIRHRTRRLPRKLGLLALRATLREPSGRAVRLGMLARGVLDGVTGRLGLTVGLETSEVSPGPTEREPPRSPRPSAPARTGS